MLSCHDNFEANFDNYPSMLSYHQALSMASSWRRCKVKDLHVEPLDSASPLYGHPAAFAAGTSEDAIKDTAANLGLALNVDGNIYPVRSTAYKTLTERAKINGTALPKLSRKDLANVLNACLSVHNSDALLLIRNEKVSAVHSGDESFQRLLYSYGHPHAMHLENCTRTSSVHPFVWRAAIHLTVWQNHEHLCVGGTHVAR